MATTSPDNIWSPDAGDDYALTTDLAAMADTIQDAITANRVDLLGLDSARPANGSPGLVDGMTWYSTDTRTLWRYNGTIWSVEYRPLAPYASTVSGVGAGVTVSTEYEQRGKAVLCEIEFTRTALGRPTAQVSFTLPVPISSPTMTKHLGVGLFNLPGVNQYDIRARYSGSNVVVVNFPGVAGSALASGNNLNDVFPTNANHAVGTTLNMTFTYRAA